MWSLYFFSVWLHILAATVWVGGMLFLSFVLIPLMRHPEMKPLRAPLVHLIGIRFRIIGWMALAVLLVTGLYNIAARGFTLQDAFNGTLWSGEFGRTLAEKLTTFGIVLIISALHDFWVGPKVMVLTQKGNPSPESESWRKAAAWLGRVNLVLALLMVTFGIMLVRGRPF